MKKIIQSLLLFLMLMGQVTLMAQSLSVKQNSYTQSSYAFTAPQFEVAEVQANGTPFVTLSVEGAAPSTQLGRPNLPIITEMIEIPLCSKVKVTLSNVNQQSLKPLPFPLMPVQPAPSKSDRTPLPFVIDSAYYQTDAFTDQPAAWVEVMGVARDRNLALLRVSPFSYNPVTGELNRILSMDITLTFEDADMAATQQMHRRYYSPDFSLGSNLLSALPEEKEVRKDAPIHYLIVSHSSFRGQLDQFILWKKRQGFLVTVGYTDDAAVGTSSTDIATYIKNFYTNATDDLPAPTYLLLVGDNQQVPAFRSRATSPSNQHVTDLYFATWTDGDNIPDCYLGRFSAESVADLTPQLEKSILYESYSFANPSYLGKGILIAGVDAGQTDDNAYKYADPAMDYVAKYYVNATQGFTDVKYYKNNTSFAPTGVTVTGSSQTTATANTLKNLYNQGYGWINYSAHGNDDCWGEPYFSTSNVAAMTNNGKPSVMIGNCCLTGRFNSSSPCFGEALLRKNNNAGAVVYFGCTNSSYWPHDFCWEVGYRTSISNTMDATYNANNLGMYDRLFHTHNEPYAAWHTTSGAMITAGNMAVETYGSYQQYYWEIYELFGDPSLMPWLAPANVMSVTNSSTIIVGETNYTVTAAPYAYVALTTINNHDLVAAAYANASGVATLTLPASLTPGQLELAIWAQNYQPTFKNVTVIIPNGPFVMITDVVPTSGSLQPGQVATFDITLTNVGTTAPTQDLIEFTSSTPKALVIQPETHFNACAPGDTITLTGVNAVYLSESLTNGENLRFSLNVNFGGVVPSNYTTNFLVNSSSLTFSEAQLSSALTANSTSTITCTVTNTGSVASSPLSFNLINNYGLLTHEADEQTSAPLNPGESTTLSFNVTVGPNVPDAIIPFYLYVTDNHGTTLAKEFNLPVGTCFTDDFETGTLTHLDWVNGDNPWQITNSVSMSGNYSARSKANLSNRASSKLSITGTSILPDTISFSYKVSSEEDWDKFTFSIDGAIKLTASGEVDWTTVSYPVSAGTHQYEFAYTKDFSASNGEDCAWIDDVRLPIIGGRCTFTVDTICQGATYTFAGRTINTETTGHFAYVDSSSNTHQYLSLYVLGQPQVTIQVEDFGPCRLLKASGASSYEWSTGETGNCIVVCPSGSVDISVTGYRGGCSSTAQVNLLAIADISTLPEVKLYPNPAQSSVTITANDIRSVQLINLMGQTIQRKQVAGDQTRLNLHELPSGIYFVRVETANAVVVKKLIRK